jgi:hypothetical protein
VPEAAAASAELTADWHGLVRVRDVLFVQTWVDAIVQAP